ncbi:cache domain-containing sensor histidine kinase [Clostridium estertheticum]|uniref:cache domain-containing sensor histidine kinase n=1 Tax=Clostridium estertheticum TaxID=238834 RepID=UPI001C7DE889|nr:sensor histidine kinase [Clostridium estertheticum]MBX4266359.1 sensor histidine kinase [Clostridium estertheticum]WLC86949.1 sensor histidine kinase [Clostridium estertheticum]
MRYKIMEKFKDCKIGTKIIIYYFIISVISITLSTFIYQNINKRIMTKKVSEMAVQTLQTIDSNLKLLIYTVNNESKILLSNLHFQNILKNGDERFNYNSQTAINRYLTEFIQSNMSISSVYVFDNYGNRYFVDKKVYKSFSLNDIKNTYWYDELQKAQGGYIIKLNGGGLFNQAGQKFVSFIRIINDLESQKPTGIMVINIPEDAISNSFRNITGNNDVDIMLKDENDNDIIHSKELTECSISEDIKKNLKNEGKGDHYYFTEKVNGNNYIISYLKNNLNWTIISKVPFSEISKQSNIYMLVILGMLLLSGIMSFLGLILVSSSITRPIDKLIKSMRAVENGEFKKVSVGTGNDEIAKLKNVYNTMIYKIENLIEQIMVEQKIKRKAELNVLQAQIKPHFLYNSFDAISCLALEGKNDDVYKIIKALGNFYRTSLSNGREVISVREELQTVKSYLTILQIRYENLFVINMDIDDRCDEYKILKLVLQPIVENSIYHGIKPSRRTGNIFISTSLKNDYVELIVGDDGVGISEDKLNSIRKLNTAGIGLRGTMERLNIFYNGKSKLEVESKLGFGTKVTIRIPIKQEGNNG